MSVPGREQAWEWCQSKFDHETLDYIMESTEAMRDLLCYIDEQPKALGLASYIEAWLCTKDGLAFEERTLDNMMQNLPEPEHDYTEDR